MFGRHRGSIPVARLCVLTIPKELGIELAQFLEWD
jgi:hypothetical protein